MTEIEYWDYDDEDEFVAAVAGDIKFVIESALDARNEAIVALPGGPAMQPIHDKLAEAQIPWKRVTIIPTDDRLVPMGDDASHVTALARAYMTLGARVFPITSDAAEDYEAAGGAANARLQDVSWPLDLVLLGVDDDGHTAGLYQGAGLEEALDPKGDARAIGIMPDNGDVARVSLTLSAITSARTLTLAVTGQAARDAIEASEGADHPVGKVLSAATVPVDIHWKL